MRLYYHPASTNSLRVEVTARHLGIALDLVLVDLFKGEHTAPDFLKLNPNHRVPVLEHDGFVLWESYAIMQYLADLTPGQTLYPSAAQARADVNRWLFWCGSDFMPGVGILNWENNIKKMLGAGPADAQAVAHGEQLLKTAATVLDGHLAQRQWICGDALTLADFALAAPLADQQRARFPTLELQHLQRWFGHIQTLPAWTSNSASPGGKPDSQ